MESGLIEVAKNLGMAGIFLLGLVTVSKLLIKQLQERIDHLEERANQCEEDRTALHSKLHDLEKGIIKENTEVLSKVLSKI